tara:strand:+ start:4802 stop:6592 length:1791 start_codon:yes stop_codon:yes gene_type:complete
MEVILEDQRVTLQGPLLEQPITPFGAIFGTGEQKRSDLSLARHYPFEEFAGGLGVERIAAQGQTDRFNDQAGVNTLKGSEFMLETEQQAAVVLAAGVTPTDISMEYKGAYLVVGSDNKVYRYASGAFTAVDTPPQAPTDMLIFEQLGVEYAVVAYSDGTDSGMMHSLDGITFVDVSDNGTFLATFDNKLIVYDDTTGNNYIRSTASITSPVWTNVVINTQGTARGMTIFRDQDGQPSIWYATALGLFQIDYTNSRSHYVYDYSSTPYDNNGKHLIEYNGQLFFPMGQELLAISPQGSVISLGPDRDDGITNSDHGNRITNIITMQNFLVICNTNGTDKSSVMINPGAGWHVQASGNAGGDFLLHETSSGSRPRLWFANGSSAVKYQEFNDQSERRLPFTGQTFESSGTIITPWVTLGFPEFPKTIFSVVLSGRDFSDEEYMKVEYQTDYIDESDQDWKMLSRTTGDDTRHEMIFGGGSGIEATAIRLRITVNRGATKTNTPVGDAIILKYLPQPEDRLSWILTIPLYRDSLVGKNASQTIAWLRALKATSRQRNIQFTPGPSKSEDGEFQVQITNGPIISRSESAGTANITLAVPI